MDHADLLERIHALERGRRRDRRVSLHRNLVRQNSEWHRFEQQLESKTATIRRLRSLLRTAVEFEDESMEEGDDDADADSDADMDEETSEHPGESDTLSDNDAENSTYAGPAIWDDIDKVYRCSECLFEVEEGYCRTCNLAHDWDAVSTCRFSFSERVFFSHTNPTER
jgi:hypothetical protein